MRRATRGFTLFELLVVMALVALVIVLVPPMIMRGFPAISLKSAAREVAAGLREARGRAIARNTEVAFTIDVDERVYRVGIDDTPRDLPEALDIALFTAQSELLDPAEGGIRFFADGSSTGGRVTVSYDAARYEIVVDWLTGHVAIRE
jgi:general secretion pathway protein H